jgi:hypothetical protein
MWKALNTNQEKLMGVRYEECALLRLVLSSPPQCDLIPKGCFSNDFAGAFDYHGPIKSTANRLLTRLEKVRLVPGQGNTMMQIEPGFTDRQD